MNVSIFFEDFLKILKSFQADDKLLNDSHAFEHMVTIFGEMWKQSGPYHCFFRFFKI